MNIVRHHLLSRGRCASAGTLPPTAGAKKNTSAAVLTTVVMAMTLIGSAPAFAAKGPSGGGGGNVVTPPPPPPPPVVTPSLPPDAIVFTNRDFVSISNLRPNEDLLVEVVPDGSASATAVANAKTDANGFVEVNHPGGVCWDSITPDIVANDLIKVSYKNPPTGTSPLATQTLTQDVKATQAEYGDLSKSFVVVKGTAQLKDGSPIDLSLLEVRIINKEFIDPSGKFSKIGKRDIRADSAGGRIGGTNGTGILAYDKNDNPTGTKFTATFSGLSSTELQLVVEGQTRIMGWKSTDAAGNRIGVTIYEVGEFGGPGMGNCPSGPGGVVAAQTPSSDLVSYDPNKLVDAKNAPQAAIATVFPDRDFVSIEGYAPGSELQVLVRRPSLPSGGQVIGTARGFVGRSGIFEVNHPGGVCWSGQTPDIAGDDYIDIVKIASNNYEYGQTQRVINTTITKPASISGTQVVVSGTTFDEKVAGRPLVALPLDLVEQRIINPDFRGTSLGRRDIRAIFTAPPVARGSGTIAPYPAGCNGTNCVWTASYAGLDANMQNLAVAGQSRSMAWLNTFSGNRSGVTISEFGETGGPGMGNCPARGTFTIPVPMPPVPTP